MKIGDRAILINRERLKTVYLGGYEGKYVKISRVPDGPRQSMWYVRFEDATIGAGEYWVPEECIQLVGSGSSGLGNAIAGDKALLINRRRLNDVNLAGHENREVVLLIRMSVREVESKTRMEGESGWWVRLASDEHAQRWYVPTSCLAIMRNDNPQPSASTHVDDEIEKAKQCGCYYGDCKETTTQKETDSMYLYNVTVIRTPSTLAQQAGEIDTIVCGPTPVLAKDEKSACLKIGAMNAEAILKEEKSILRVVMAPGQ